MVDRDAVSVVDEIEELYGRQGGEPNGEKVTMLEHSLLTVQAAEQAGADDELIAASPAARYWPSAGRARR